MSPRASFKTMQRAASGGFSLVELLVSVTIGLVVTLAVFGVLITQEARKRNATSLNDVNQSGAYATYVLDRAIRSAGTGFSQAWPLIGGCRLNATLRDRADANTVARWPRTATLPDPFAALPQTLRLAPVVIFRNASLAGSDVLQVMNTAGGFGEAPAEVSPGNLSSLQVSLPNTIGFRANDLLMLASATECLITQIAPSKTACAGDPTAAASDTRCDPVMQFGGRYYDADSTMFSTLAAADRSFAIGLGNLTNSLPQLMLYGVGENSTLFGYDALLLQGVDAAEPVAEGVRALYAAYALDPALSGAISWQTPTATGDWSGESLTDGSVAANGRLRQIVAVRIGMVMRSSNVERDDVAPESLTLFADLPQAVRRTFDLTSAGENRHQRHRLVEVTVPVRNFLMRPAPTP